MRFKAAALFFLFIIPAWATAFVPTGPSPVISIEATPAHPAPGELVTLKGYASVSKGEYTYVWAANGEGIDQGVDLNSVTFSAGVAGSSTTIELFLVDQSGTARGRAVYILRPADIDLIWEGDTYTPPSYKGKPLPNGESTIIIEAIPHFILSGERVPRNTLVYEWEVDGKKVTDQSGYGKFTARVRPATFKSGTTVSVTAKNRNGTITGETAVFVPTANPSVVVYEKKPLLGLWFESALRGTLLFSGEEMTYRAFPFYVNEPNALQYVWELGGKPVMSTSNTPGEITFRKAGDGRGTFPVKISIEKEGSLYERGSAEFNVSFD